jgi:flagellar basal-body rod protein FlgB
MPVKSLFGRTYQILERTLDIAKNRHGLIAGNVANVSTPGFHAKEIDFKKTLEDTIQKRSIDIFRTHPLHFGVSHDGTAAYEVDTEEQEGVDIDREMSRLAENNLRYQTGVEALLRKFAGLKNAITEGGR